MTRARSAVIALPLVALACNSPSAGSRPDGGGGGGGGADAGADGLPPSDAAKLQATPGTWTWIDVPGMACDDGSMTGVGVNPAPDGSGADVLVFLMGGGACWDAASCFVLNTAVHGPYASAQFQAQGVPTLNRALDRARTTNPFRGFNLVFVPYCTGDLHAGSNVATYDVLGPRQYHHVGRPNLQAALERVRATWPSATRLVVSGSSAGGFGATLAYDLFRRAYPLASATLVDDSGPFLETTGIPADERAAWYANWHLGDVVDPLCPTCRNDMSQIYPALAALYPNDRMALLSSLQDQTIRTYFLILLAADFELQLRRMITDRLDPLARFHTFLIPGESHTMMGTPDTIMAGGLTLEAWLGQMVSGDAAWSSVGP